MSVKRVLVYGGKGALGRACVSAFKRANWWVSSIDLAENEDANSNILVKPEDGLLAQEKQLVDSLQSILEGNKLDAIVCVAGGWAGGDASKGDFVKNTQMMIDQSVNSSVLAARLSSLFLSQGKQCPLISSS